MRRFRIPGFVVLCLLAPAATASDAPPDLLWPMAVRPAVPSDIPQRPVPGSVPRSGSSHRSIDAVSTSTESHDRSMHETALLCRRCERGGFIEPESERHG